jgi:glycerophosphoryl diester phosphodiesterase
MEGLEAMTHEPTNFFYSDHILILGHRGASQHAPENTLPAFQLAAQQGADGIELDVQLSRDGEVIIMHDFSVDKTTNGQGKVKEKTLAELKALDAGRYFSNQFAGTTIPTLSELFMVMGPVLLYNIELKTTSFNDQGLEVEVIRLIEDYNLQDRAMVSSFNPFALMRAYRINPKIKRGLLWAPNLSFYLRRQLFRNLAKPDMFHPYWGATTLGLVKKEHEQGILVNVWTCNEPEAMQRMIKMGVDAIMTDRPDLLKQVLNDPEAY